MEEMRKKSGIRCLTITEMGSETLPTEYAPLKSLRI